MGCMHSKHLSSSSTSDHEIVEEVDNGATAQIISQIHEQNEAGSGLELWVDGHVNTTDIINERINQSGMCTNTIFIVDNGLHKQWISQMAEKELFRLSMSTSSFNYYTMSGFLDFLSQDSSLDQSHNLLQTVASTSGTIVSCGANMSKYYGIDRLPFAAAAAGTSFTGDFLRDGQEVSIPLLQNGVYFEVTSNHCGIWYGSYMDRGDRTHTLLFTLKTFLNINNAHWPNNPRGLNPPPHRLKPGKALPFFGNNAHWLSYKQISVWFEEIPQSRQEEILMYVYMNWEDLHQDPSIVEALKETRFVSSSDGGLYKPKDLFDPDDVLLTSVFTDEVHKFPGTMFVSDKWLNILRQTGLRNTGDVDVLLTCAKKVEFLGAESMSNTTTEVALEIWSLAETLMHVIFQNFNLFLGNNLCHILGKIACIPAEKGFPFESGKEGVKRVLCSYSEAVLLQDWPLAWSVAPIISRAPPESSWGDLHLRSPPPFAIVLKHLQAEKHTMSSFSRIEEATFEVLTYLDVIWGTISSSDVSKLRKVAFIPVANATHIASPNGIFVHLTVDLFPLAFELPSRYLQFVKILRELGLKDKLSVSSTMMILTGLQKRCGYQSLNVNELRAVMNLLHFLLNETIEQPHIDRSNWESQLFVPDDGCRLVHPNSCVYVDLRGSSYVKYIDSSKLRFAHHDVSETLCLAFGIAKLSNVVVEEINGVEQLINLEEIGSVSLVSIRQKLLNRSFQVAVSSVLRNVSSSTPGSKNVDFPTLQKSLESVAERLQFVHRVYTRFWLLPMSLDITCVSKESGIPEWESGPNHRALYYVNRSHTCMLVAKPPSYISVLDLIVIVVSQVIGSPVPLPIGPLFSSPKGSETAVVNILQLSTNERLMDGVGIGTHFLGREVLLQDAMKVGLDISRPYLKGEIVAWQKNTGEKLKYGRILENVIPPTGQALYGVNIETSPGKAVTICSSCVFYFRNFSTGYNFLATDMMPEEADARIYSMYVKQPEFLGGLKLRNQQPPTEDLEYRRVSAEEYSEAVAELLSGAGIKLDTEKQYLLQKNLCLQEQLSGSQAALLFEQEKSEVATKEADTAKAEWQCQICLASEINVTLVPCGHVLCHQCSTYVSRCPFCRVQVSKIIKIYRP